MKSEILNMRIPASLKEKLEIEASDNNTTLSDLARDIISTYYDNNEVADITFDLESKFYTSNEFIFFITWLFEKRLNYYDSNNIQVFEGLKRIAMKAMTNCNFDTDLKTEFEKVYVDLSRFIYEYEIPNNHFRFCIPNLPQSFNYFLLVNLIYKKAFENTIFM